MILLFIHTHITLGEHKDGEEESVEVQEHHHHVYYRNLSKIRPWAMNLKKLLKKGSIRIDSSLENTPISHAVSL